jgi:hypothetical protein
MSRAVAGVKPLCGLARVVSENSLRATKGPLRSVGHRGGARVAGHPAHREVVIYVYTAMVSSRLGREYKRHYGAGTGNYLPAKPPERAAPSSYPICSALCPRARSVELFIFEQSPRLYQSFLSAPFLSGARAGAAGMSGTKKVWPG